MNESQVRAIVQSILADARYNVSKVAYHEHNSIDSPNVPYGNLSDAPGYFCLAKNTNGTTAVDVFGSGGTSFNFTITGIFLIASDTTAGTITITNNQATVATIAKGTVAGAMVGATSLSNTTYTSGRQFQIVSSSAGNSTVFVTFTV